MMLTGFGCWETQERPCQRQGVIYVTPRHAPTPRPSLALACCTAETNCAGSITNRRWSVGGFTGGFELRMRPQRPKGSCKNPLPESEQVTLLPKHLGDRRRGERNRAVIFVKRRLQRQPGDGGPGGGQRSEDGTALKRQAPAAGVEPH